MTKPENPAAVSSQQRKTGASRRSCGAAEACALLEKSVFAALEYYSNVHRGTGHNSIVSTELYEKARDVVLDHLGLDGRNHTVVFCTPRRVEGLRASLRAGAECRVISSQDLGLPLGVRAVVVTRESLPRGVPYEPGGGTIKMVSFDSVSWADAPERFEAGTPNIVGVIAFARALQIAQRLGQDVFRENADPVNEGLLDRDDFPDLSGNELLVRLRESLIGRRNPVPTEERDLPYVNFDNGASTPTFIPIWQTVSRTWRQPEESWPAIVEQVKLICASFFGAPRSEYEVIFTCNTTEAVNVAARAFGARAGDGRTVVLNTLLEHNSNELPWRHLNGVPLMRLPVDDEGFIDLEALERILAEHNEEHRHGEKRIGLVAACGASNVMGSYNDIAAISRIAHRYRALALIDAAQLAAHRRIEMEKDGIDCLAFSGHKMYAPFGAGGLVVRRGLLERGEGELAQARVSGTENVAGIAALGKAMLLLQRIGMDTIVEEERRLTARALHGLCNMPEVRVYGVKDPCAERFPRKGGVVCFELKKVPHNLVAKLLAEEGGIGVRYGCFCVNIFVKKLLGVGRFKNWVAHTGLVLFPKTMEKLLAGLVRASFGLENEEAEVDHMLATLGRVARRPVRLPDRLLAGLHFGTPSLPRTRAERRIEELVRSAVERVYSKSDIAGPEAGR